jgi:hypothetical protein
MENGKWKIKESLQFSIFHFPFSVFLQIIVEKSDD